MKIKVKRHRADAIIPTKSHSTDAGWDLYALEDCFVQTLSRVVVDTGISMAIPEGYVGLIWPRSGLAVDKGIDILAGVIDSGYRNTIKVCILNTNSHNSKDGSFFIHKGDRIAQLLIQEVPHCYLEEHDELEIGDRNMAGLGSTGL